MRSLIQDILAPDVVLLLDALDTTLNSNTFFFKLQSDVLITEKNKRDILESFLHSPLFMQAVSEFDKKRGENFYPALHDENDHALTPLACGSLVKDAFKLELMYLDEHAFAERLQWMLCTAFSPYDTHINEREARSLISSFFHHVFGDERWTHNLPDPMQYGRSAGWPFSDVKPNFLYSTGYFDSAEIPHPSPPSK